VAGANDNAYLFLNPQLGTQPSLIQADTNSLGEFDFTFDRLRVFAGGNDAGNSRPYAELVIDEYRLGETYADVTPYIPAAPPGPLVITNVSLVGNSILLAGSGGTPTWNYEVLSSADLQVPSSNWPVAGSNSFDPAGNFAWTNPVDLNAGEAYYRLFVPNQTSPPPVLPGIVSPPTNLTVAVGQPAAFSVIANGTEPLGYQWFFNTNSPLPAATNTSYSIASAQLTNAGTYSVRVANDFGAITSSFALLTVTAAPPVFSANYYVATYGSDSNPGTNINAPFATLSKAVSVASAGKLIYVRGGTYNWSSRVTMSISGTPTQPIRVFAYPGESPVFNFASQPTGDSNQGISLSGNCWHLKGLEIANAGDNGIIVTGKTNTVELCVLRGNRDTGLQLHNAGAAYNYVLNCDSYRNYDPANQGENADGFAAKFTLGPGNLFSGCRSWENSDDGWDVWEATSTVVMTNCWTWRNGTNAWGDGGAFAGDGNGIKLGGNFTFGPHLVYRCLAFKNPGNGFDQNNNTGNLTLYNNTAWANTKKNFYLNHGTNVAPSVVCNNLSIAGGSTDGFNAGTVQLSNSWQVVTSPPANAGDVLSVDEALALLPRQPDGSLPVSPFLRPVPGGRLVDAGVDVGLPYNGTAPDIGAFED
jgi:hypothetical protein